MINMDFKKYAHLFGLVLFFYTSELSAQTTLSDSIRMSVDFFETDLKKAEGMLDIDERRLVTEPDSIQYMYHYYKAAVDELNGRSSKTQLQHLLTAKKIMESKLGIYHTVYFEIINAIGEKYEEFGMPDSAMVYWEEGIIKGLPFIGTKDEDENIKTIIDNLASYYKKKGHPEIAQYIGNFKLAGSVDYAYELLDKSNELKKENNFSEAMEAVNEAINVFTKNGEDGETLGWVYNQRGILLMNLGRYDEAIRSLNDAEKILLPIYGKDSYEYATLLHNRGHLFQLKKEYKQARVLLIQARDLQIKTNGEAIPNTLKYLKEVEQSIKESL